MVNQVSRHQVRPRDDRGPAVESLRSASVGEGVVAGDAGYGSSLNREWFTGISRSFGHVLSTLIGSGLARLLSRLRAVRHPWCELSDYLLTDIGKTRGDAELEKLRHQPLIRNLPGSTA